MGRRRAAPCLRRTKDLVQHCLGFLRGGGLPVVLDTAAAGDTFNGAFVTALAEGMSQEEAIAFGNKAASISVTRKGAQTSIPSREEVDGYRP